MSSRKKAVADTPEARKRQANRECRRATLFLFALAVVLFAVSERWLGPFPFVGYVSYVGFLSVVLLPLVLLYFHSVRWRLTFFLLFYLCFGVISAAPHPADPIIRDVARIQPGMLIEEARSILSPHIAQGNLKRRSGNVPGLLNGTGWLTYTAPTLESIDYVYISCKRGRVEYATISWD